MSESIIKGELDLADVHTVLVKLFFTNPKHVPSGIPYLQRPSSDEMDELHATKARYLGGDKTLGAVGRHREGRVDTGEPVIKNLPGTRPVLLQGDLVAAGFELAGFRYWKQEQEGRATKFVVTASFTKKDRPKGYAPHVAQTFEELSKSSVWFCHVWKNPDGVATINLVGKQPKNIAQHYLMVGAKRLVMGVSTDEAKQIGQTNKAA